MMRRNASAAGTASGGTSNNIGDGAYSSSKDRLPHHHTPATTNSNPLLPKISDHGDKKKKGNSDSSWSSKHMIVGIGICIVIILGLSSVRSNNSSRNINNTTAKVVDQIKSALVEEIQQLHEDFGHHHAVNPISSDELEGGTKVTKDGRTVPNYHLPDIVKVFSQEEEAFSRKPVARGVAGRPYDRTPALMNAQRAHIECDVNVDSLAYWNENPSDHISSFHVPNNDEYYISFSPDGGGWNNVRMSMEIIFVLAAVTGRTLILPPKAPLYLLGLDQEKRHRGFADFFPLETQAFQSQVKVISFAEFLQRNEPNVAQFTITDEEFKTKVYAASEQCDKREKSTENCKVVYDYLKSVGDNSNISAVDSCVIFDEIYFRTGSNDSMPMESQEYIEEICGPKRHAYFWTNDYNSKNKLIHFRASEKQYRLLSHFYGMIHFTNATIGNHYKRFVRDYLHYHDSIYCAAGKVIQAIQLEGRNRSRTSSDGVIPPSYDRDEEGTGGFSAFHVRRGDLQYKKVKISAQEWYDNTKELLLPGELLYIATDERNKTFFDDLKQHYEIRFLDDYWDIGDLDSLDPNYMGMIDTIIASRGRIFVGTFFSTFTGYINRLRGYHGISMIDSYYSWLPRKNHTHEWKLVDDAAYAYEWPDGWIGIDADTSPSRDVF